MLVSVVMGVVVTLVVRVVGVDLFDGGRHLADGHGNQH